MDPHNGDETMNDTTMMSCGTIRKRICLLDHVAHDQDVIIASKLFNVPVVTSETGVEFLDDASWMTYFVMSEFEGPLFDDLSQHKKHKYENSQLMLKRSLSIIFIQDIRTACTHFIR